MRLNSRTSEKDDSILKRIICLEQEHIRILHRLKKIEALSKQKLAAKQPKDTISHEVLSDLGSYKSATRPNILGKSDEFKEGEADCFDQMEIDEHPEESDLSPSNITERKNTALGLPDGDTIQIR